MSKQKNPSVDLVLYEVETYRLVRQVVTVRAHNAACALGISIHGPTIGETPPMPAGNYLSEHWIVRNTQTGAEWTRSGD